MTDYPPVDPEQLNTRALLDMIDFTLLKPEQSVVEYASFLKTAGKWRFHSVFLPPCYVPMAVGMLSGTDVVVGAPISFPFGYCAPETKAAEAVLMLEEGAGELDVVMNISAALSGEWELVEEDLVAVVEAVRGWEKLTMKGPIPVKLILETPYLDDDAKREACRRAMAAGLDFVKTATGLGPGGATPGDIRLMKEVVGDELGVKASGGVRTWADALAMIEAGACRIGTSAGPEIIENFARTKGEASGSK